MLGPARLLTSVRMGAPAGLLAGVFAVGFMFTATPFLIPEVASRYGLSEGIAGAISIVQVGGFVISTATLPRFIAPSARLFKGAAIALLVANLLSALPSDYWLLLGLRGSAGLAGGVITWLVWSDAMRDMGAMRGISAAGPLAALVGAPILSLVAELGDRAVFLALAALVLPAALLPCRIRDGIQTVRRVSRSRSNRVLLAALFLLTFSGASLFVFMAVAVREHIGITPVLASLGFSLNAAGGLLGARLAGRHRRPGWWLASAGPAAMLAVAGGSVPTYFLGMAWWGFAFWMGLPGVLAMLSARSLTPVERAGDAQALMAAGRACAPLLGGAFIDAGAYVGLAAVAGTGITVAGITVIGVEEGRERLPATDPRTVEHADAT